MVVLGPLFDGEKTQICKTCQLVGLASPILERASFLRMTCANSGYRGTCRACVRRGERAAYRRRRESETPEQRDARRAVARAARERAIERDPEGFAAKHRVAAAKSYERRLESMGALAIKEENRIDRMVLAERRNRKRLPSRNQVKNKRKWSRSETLPIKPYRLWLEHLSVVETRRSRNETRDPLVRVAEFLDCSTRRLYYWMHEASTVNYAAVDRVVTEHGGTTPEEVYRTYGNGTYFETLSDGSFAFVVHRWALPEVEPSREFRVLHECRSPGCRHSVEDDKRFCAEHGAVLSRVKKEYDQDSQAFRSRIRRKGATPRCCNPACKAERLAAERFCDDCSKAGWSEDNYE